MSTKIRLSRAGRNKLPYYHIVIADSRSPRDGKYIEQIGTYDPLVKDENKKKVTLKLDRVEHWLSVGATPTERVAIILNQENVKSAEKFKPVFNPKEKKPKEDKKKK